MKRENLHWGSTLGDFLDEEGIRESAKMEAVARVIAWQSVRAMKRGGTAYRVDEPQPPPD